MKKLSRSDGIIAEARMRYVLAVAPEPGIPQHKVVAWLPNDLAHGRRALFLDDGLRHRCGDVVGDAFAVKIDLVHKLIRNWMRGLHAGKRDLEKTGAVGTMSVVIEPFAVDALTGSAS
jgi:hypothetical protein